MLNDHSLGQQKQVYNMRPENKVASNIGDYFDTCKKKKRFLNMANLDFQKVVNKIRQN